MSTRVVRAAAEDPGSAAAVATVALVLGFPVATALHFGVGNGLVVAGTVLAVVLTVAVALGVGD